VFDHEARFANAEDEAGPGRYAVRLDSGIAVELVATAHGAHHRYDLGGEPGTIVIDLAKTLSGGAVDDVVLELDDAAGELTGQLHHVGGMSGGFGGYTIHFVIRARTAWADRDAWDTGAALHYDGAEPVELQVGVSLVSLAGARANLDAELPAWDLEATRAAAEAAWRAKTGVVLVTGGTEADRRIFYTSLYHAFLMPTLIEDADGTYQLAGAEPAVSGDWRQMSDASLWDTYRTVHPLYAWLAPDSARDGARSLVAFAEATGFFPRWPIATGEAGTMLGASAEIVIADAVARGVDGVAADLAWPILRAAAMDPVAPAGGRGGRDHVEAYMQYGYVPAEIDRSASHTTEYAHDDFALGNLAAALGHDADAAALDQRRLGWRALYDPEVGFVRARHADGSFPDDDFDPLDQLDDYAEANAWQSLWMTGAHDVDGLVELLGGGDAAIAKLETFFDETRRDWERGDPASPNFPRPYYWHGNEPDLNAVYLFAQAGRPDLTQRWVRWLLDTHYTDTPAGLAGNDDGGTLGAWYVFSALGLYPIPGSDRYVLGAPRFDRARIRVGGRELVIEAEGLSAENLYVQEVRLDGAVVDGVELTHAELVGASELRFVMGPEP
jgi:predicted alpha-1,2-mannosidase